jgi:hypothetical protein
VNVDRSRPAVSGQKTQDEGHTLDHNHARLRRSRELEVQEGATDGVVLLVGPPDEYSWAGAVREGVRRVLRPMR